MGLYNQLFGRNKHADEILGLIGLRPKDIERFGRVVKACIKNS